MSRLSRFFPKIRPLLERVKDRAKVSLLTTTNTVVGIVVGVFTLAVYGIELTEKIFGEEQEKEILSDTGIVSEDIKPEPKSKTAEKKKAPNPQYQSTGSSNPRASIEKKIEYFNSHEVLLNAESIALFIKSSNSQIDFEFQQKISNDFQVNNITASTSFFTSQSLAYFNQFYSANKTWLKTTNVENHVRKYLIGSIKEIKSSSSADSEITIINLVFNGKIIDVNKNLSSPITKEIRETNYQEHRALEDAYNRLSKELVETF